LVPEIEVSLAIRRQPREHLVALARDGKPAQDGQPGSYELDTVLSDVGLEVDRKVSFFGPFNVRVQPALDRTPGHVSPDLDVIPVAQTSTLAGTVTWPVLPRMRTCIFSSVMTL